jgi:hypothetical protein
MLRIKKPRDHGRQTVCRSLGGKEPNRLSTAVSSLTSHTSIPGGNRENRKGQLKIAREPKSRRQQHGSAWHWKQTDCWYYTPTGARKRVALFDEKGDRTRGKENKDVAQLALARVNTLLN